MGLRFVSWGYLLLLSVRSNNSVPCNVARVPQQFEQLASQQRSLTENHRTLQAQLESSEHGLRHPLADLAG
jgi:hypothetical protein